MKVSVVIPVYNAERFIQKSYESILNQNLKDFEIIYVNNNSVDSSFPKIQEIAQQDSRITLLSQEKQGAAAARNMGIASAKGQYVYIFDVDDEIYPNALNSMMEVLDTYPQADAVFGKMIKSNKSIPETDKQDDETLEVIIKDKPYWGLKWFEDLKTVVGPPAFLYRKATLENLGGYNEDLVICEDTALDIELGMTNTVAFLDKYVYLYYKHEESVLQKSKADTNQIFILWSRLAKSHLPFYYSNEVPRKFKTILFNQLYSTMGKLIYYTQGSTERKTIYKKLQADIKPHTITPLIKALLRMLVLFPSKVLLKTYVYYISPLYVKNNLKSF